MKDDGDLRREIEALRERLSRLSEASLRINESLDLDSVLQGVLDSARTLTGARYALITPLDGSGQAEEFLVSGLTPDEARQLWGTAHGSAVLPVPQRTSRPAAGEGLRRSRPVDGPSRFPSADAGELFPGRPAAPPGGLSGQHQCCQERARSGVHQGG